MCGRYTLRRHNLEALKRELRVDSSGGSYLWEPRYNIAPTAQVPVLVRQENGQRHMLPMIWGIPRTRNSRVMRQINARAEAALPHSARCAVITDGFYEWAGEQGSTRRQPYFCHRPDDGLILMAGLWQWHHGQESYLQTFAIVTTAANSMLAPIHDRMPAILEGDALALWLNPKTDPRDVRGLLAPATDNVFELRKVSPLINSVKNNGPELIEPVN